MGRLVQMSGGAIEEWRSVCLLQLTAGQRYVPTGGDTCLQMEKPLPPQNELLCAPFRPLWETKNAKSMGAGQGANYTRPQVDTYPPPNSLAQEPPTCHQKPGGGCWTGGVGRGK